MIENIYDPYNNWHDECKNVLVFFCFHSIRPRRETHPVDRTQRDLVIIFAFIVASPYTVVVSGRRTGHPGRESHTILTEEIRWFGGRVWAWSLE